MNNDIGQTIRTKTSVIERIVAWNEGVVKHCQHSAVRDIIQFARCWIAYEHEQQGWLFAPFKFAGSNLTFDEIVSGQIDTSLPPDAVLHLMHLTSDNNQASASQFPFAATLRDQLVEKVRDDWDQCSVSFLATVAVLKITEPKVVPNRLASITSLQVEGINSLYRAARFVGTDEFGACCWRVPSMWLQQELVGSLRRLGAHADQIDTLDFGVVRLAASYVKIAKPEAVN